jgi:hypothetical protein
MDISPVQNSSEAIKASALGWEPVTRLKFSRRMERRRRRRRLKGRRPRKRRRRRRRKMDRKSLYSSVGSRSKLL